ncbi:MAG: hypothetical protein R6V08_06635 [Desulfuromonadales bacterium]
MTTFLLVAFLLFGLANFFFSLMILRTLRAAGVRVGIFEIRWQVHRHLKTYKKVTAAETGRVGFSFYGYWISLAGLVICAVLLVSSLTR